MGNNILNASRLRPETFVLDHMTIRTFYRQIQLHCLFAGEKFLQVAGMSVVCINELCESAILLTEMSGSDHDTGKGPRQGIARRARVIQCLRASALFCELILVSLAGGVSCLWAPLAT